MTAGTARRLRRVAAGSTRGQSHVVGVAVLLAVAVVALAGVTASVGVVVERTATAADADRVADAMAEGFGPGAAGAGRTEVRFGSGSFRTLDRSVRVLDAGGVRVHRRVGGLAFVAGGHRTAFVSGAVVRGGGPGARLHTPPTVATADDSVLVGVTDLNATGPDAVVAAEPTSLVLRTTVTHRRIDLGPGRYRLAIETAAPTAWERYLARTGATTSRKDFDGDGVESVVAGFPGRRTGLLVVHEYRVEVRRGAR